MEVLSFHPLFFEILLSIMDFVILSSPRYAQSNGKAERAVQTVKNLLKKSHDPCLALLAHQTSPLRSDYSTAELLMSGSLLTTVFILPATLELNWSFLMRFSKKRDKTAEKLNNGNCHNTRNLPQLKNDSHVFIENLRGRVFKSTDHPLSYFVDIPDRGSVVRKRQILRYVFASRNYIFQRLL